MTKVKSSDRGDDAPTTGLFIGKLGRGQVCVLQKGAIELPSDYHGVLPVLMDEAGGWKARLAEEMQQAGCAINVNRALL